MVESLKSKAPQLTLGAIIIVIAAVLTHWAWKVIVVLPDETLGLLGARALAHDPVSAIHNTLIFPRGTERLFSIVAAVPSVLIDGVPAQLRTLHAAIALAAALIAVPSYMIARELQVSRWWAVAAGTLTITTPWLAYSETFLNGTLATLALTVFVLVVLRATLRPSVTGDVLIFVMAAVNALARTNQMAFFAVALIAVGVHTFRVSHPADGFRRRCAQLPKDLWRGHPVLVAGTLLAALVVFAVGAAALTGSYSNAIPWHGVTFKALWDRTGLTIATLAFASGFIPAVFGGWWLLRNCFRPAEESSGVFSVIAVSTMVIFTLTTWFSVPEERYIAVLVAFLPIAFVAAIARREISLVGALVSAIVIAWAAHEFGFWPTDLPYDKFIAPARIFVSRVVVAKFTLVSPIDAHAYSVVLLILCAAAIAIAVAYTRHADRERALRILSGAIVALVLCFGVASADWQMRKLTAALGGPGTDYRNLAFVDRAAGGQSVGLLQTGAASELFPSENTLVFNEQLDTAVQFGKPLLPNPCCSLQLKNATITADPRTGSVKSDHPLPPLLLQTGLDNFQLAGTEIASSHAYVGNGKQVVLKPEKPLRLVWWMRGFNSDLSLKPGKSASLVVYPQTDTTTGNCVELLLYSNSSPMTVDIDPPNPRDGGSIGMAANSDHVARWRLPPIGDSAAIRFKLRRVPKGSPPSSALLFGQPKTTSCG